MWSESRRTWWSESRRTWVPLKELLPGERLRTPEGAAAVVLAVEPVRGGQPVWNREVLGDRARHAGAAGVFGLVALKGSSELQRQAGRVAGSSCPQLGGRGDRLVSNAFDYVAAAAIWFLAARAGPSVGRVVSR